MAETTKVIRISEQSWKTLSILSVSSGKDVKTLVDDWANRLQACIDEDCKNASKIEVITFKRKALCVVSCLVPEFFFASLTSDDNLPDETDFKTLHEKVKKK